MRAAWMFAVVLACASGCAADDFRGRVVDARAAANSLGADMQAAGQVLGELGAAVVVLCSQPATQGTPQCAEALRAYDGAAAGFNRVSEAYRTAQGALDQLGAVAP